MKARILLSVAAVLLLAAGCGSDSATTSAGSGDRTIEITMRDIAYEPTSLEGEAGATVRFVFTNDGEVDHDAFIGDTTAQADHETEMRDADDAHGGGHGGGDDEAAITVEPGDTGELTHTFDGAGEIEIGCHEPGHYEAGMKIDVTVS